MNNQNNRMSKFEKKLKQSQLIPSESSKSKKKGFNPFTTSTVGFM